MLEPCSDKDASGISVDSLGSIAGRAVPSGGLPTGVTRASDHRHLAGPLIPVLPLGLPVPAAGH